MTGRRRAANAGFTLTEMLVALAVLGLLSVMLLNGIARFADTRTGAAAQAARDDSVVTAQRLLRERILAMSAVTRSDSADSLVDAQGSEASLTFYAPPLARDAPGALGRFRVFATATGDLMLYSASSLDARYDLEAEVSRGWRPQRLLAGVGRLSITYFGPDRRGVRRWQADWSKRPQPPELVRIAVDFETGDRRVWPDLVVHPRSSVVGACRVDALTGVCAVSS